MSNKPRRREGNPSRLAVPLHDAFVADLLAAIPDPSSFGSSYLASELLSKFNGTDEGGAELRKRRAIEKWLGVEERNRRTNHRLYVEETSFRVRNKSEAGRSSHRDGDRSVQSAPNSRISSTTVISTARRIVSEVLGPLTWNRGSFSGGASTSKKRCMATPAHKFASGAHITQDALPYWAHECFQDLGVRGIPFKVISGNVLFTVPKNSMIDRVACKEPDLNMYLQKGLGDTIRRKLRRVGINLNDQTRNGELARLGSIDGSLATVDLSSASDSMTTQLCARLLPVDWFTCCMALRSPYTFVNGEWHENQMMSSMGNGFTFELESLIFYALARACAYHTGTKGTISVYGDDIIIPSSLFLFLKDVLGFCGFTVNPKKSFYKGKFRESCGHHWYNGACVKPFYIRRPVSSVSDLMLHLNAFREWSAAGGIADPRIRDFYEKYEKYIPEKLKGPHDAADNETLFRPKGKSLRLTLRFKRRFSPQRGALLAWLHSGVGETSAHLTDGSWYLRKPSPWLKTASWWF